MKSDVQIFKPQRVAVIIVVALLVLNAANGFITAHNVKQAILEQIESRMLDIANTAADMLDGDAIAAFTEDSQGTDDYAKAMKSLSTFHKNIDLKFIYCLREAEDGSFEFIVDPTVGEPADFGEKATRTAALVQAGRGQPSVDKESYEDRWGRFYSAYSPVFDSKGNVAGVIGVDFSAEWFEQRVALLDGSAWLNCIVSVIIAALAMFASRRYSRAETAHEQSLLQVIRYDELTGLPNMNYFLELGERARAEIRERELKPVFLYMDLIEFRHFNQMHGFVGGDKFMAAFAQLLSSTFGHDRCSRFGQDHFAAITDSEDLNARLDDFVMNVGKVNGGMNVPVRIGVYVDVDPERGAGVCCDRAKVAAEQGLSGYRTTYTMFEPSMLAESTRRQYIIDNIDRAIEEGWIQVYYQPIVRASTGKVCDEEALARWDDPVYGLLPPDEFIPALEEAKLAYKLDLHVLELVLKKMQRFKDEGLMVVSSSINLSRYDFESCDIVDEVRRRVDASPFARDMINIEITETAVGRDLDFMKEQVKKFHDLGFDVWMDDFGSEYSSLDYLQSLNFDLIKLDMRFMQQFDNSERSRIILTEIVKMAFALGIDTIVEGVETEEQVAFLREVGCSMLQGFYFTKPLPIDQVLKRYEDGTAIGFENPDEAGYYSAVSRANLYDVGSIAREGDVGELHYFDTLPMAVAEVRDDEFSIVRCNQPYREYILHIIPNVVLDKFLSFDYVAEHGGGVFVDALRRCATQQERLGIDEELVDGTVSHAFMSRIAVNPVTGAVAVALVILAVSEQ